VNALIPDQIPPRHVYRVISPDGVVLREHETLGELIDGLGTLSLVGEL
jgi:hypothetical protein